MNTLEATVEELKSLPPARLAEAAAFIHTLTLSGSQEARLALDRAFGCMTASEAEQMERTIASHCERIDADQW